MALFTQEQGNSHYLVFKIKASHVLTIVTHRQTEMDKPMAIGEFCRFAKKAP